jgi:hypothetical protein
MIDNEKKPPRTAKKEANKKKETIEKIRRERRKIN